MNFSEFPPDQLLGKKVLYRSGRSYEGIGRRITTIVKVTKTGFRINNCANLFDFRGLAKGDREGMISECELIDPEQEQALTEEFSRNKRTKAAKEAITHEIQSGRPTLEQLELACLALGLVK